VYYQHYQDDIENKTNVLIKIKTGKKCQADDKYHEIPENDFLEKLVRLLLHGQLLLFRWQKYENLL
jgi:hypothetical protein